MSFPYSDRDATASSRIERQMEQHSSNNDGCIEHINLDEAKKNDVSS